MWGRSTIIATASLVIVLATVLFVVPPATSSVSSPVTFRIPVLRDGRYDPDHIDLSGVTGVTPAKQRRAETLLRRTLLELPRFDRVRSALAAGYFSLKDRNPGGYVHFVNFAYYSDTDVLDPAKPESLVYQNQRGRLVLVAAMFMLRPGQTFADVPDVGGPLTQWHVHDLLCIVPGTFSARAPNPDGSCPKGTQRPTDSVPMMHVWLVPTQCGPFSALEGVGGGQLAPGQTRSCDHVHGV